MLFAAVAAGGPCGGAWTPLCTGSQRLAHPHTLCPDAARIKEMTSINQGLSALASVVAALQAKALRELKNPDDHGGASNFHVPYRDSKLTHLLMVSRRHRQPHGSCAQKQGNREGWMIRSPRVQEGCDDRRIVLPPDDSSGRMGRTEGEDLVCLPPPPASTR